MRPLPTRLARFRRWMGWAASTARRSANVMATRLVARLTRPAWRLRTQLLASFGLVALVALVAAGSAVVWLMRPIAP